MISMNHKLIASGTNDNVQIFLECWNYETYTLSIHEVGKGTIHEDFDSMVWSCQKFFETCRQYGVEPKKEMLYI